VAPSERPVFAAHRSSWPPNSPAAYSVPPSVGRQCGDRVMHIWLSVKACGGPLESSSQVASCSNRGERLRESWMRENCTSSLCSRRSLFAEIKGNETAAFGFTQDRTQDRAGKVLCRRTCRCTVRLRYRSHRVRFPPTLAGELRTAFADVVFDPCRFRKLHPIDSRSAANQNMIAA
jgi:hypothetical protein